jgi:hypothetical protein
MTQDMLRGLNQIINKVAAAMPTNMRAPQHTVYDGLTQQAQTRLHQKVKHNNAQCECGTVRVVSTR